jgi:hypothetical protein
MMSKFNIHWQVVRTRARELKNPKDKLALVNQHLQSNPSKQNLNRVQNWTKMTSLGYRGDDKKYFQDYDSHLSKHKDIYNKEEKTEDFSKVSASDLSMVHRDLSKRKYGFQFKSVPKAHNEFMKKLETEIAKRKPND